MKKITYELVVYKKSNVIDKYFGNERIGGTLR